MSIYKKQVLSTISFVGSGQCAVYENDSCVLAASDGETARIIVRDSRFYQSVLGGSVAIARAYIEGWWDTPDLYALMTLTAKNIDAVNARIDSGWQKLPQVLLGLLAAMRRRLFSRKSAKKDIAAHYDLGNDFFGAFLDETLAYSCAVFPDLTKTHGDALKQASENKLEKICDKLELSKNDTLLDLGCGWGSMSFYAANKYSCDITALTLSPAQHRYINAHINGQKSENMAKAQQSDSPIKAVLSDYRNFTPPKKFRKISSVEMIEAVGEKHFNTYFRRIADFLANDGLAVVQAILIPDSRYHAARRHPDFIREYIFPGGMLPSLAIINHATQHANLQIIETEDISAHYAPTLLAWRERFNAQRARIHALGFSERFCRVWEYYFCYCAGAFAAGAIQVAQITCTKFSAHKSL